MIKNILLLYKFKHERSEKFIENILIPDLSKDFNIRKVSFASDNSENKDYWVKVVHDLIYASDIVLTIRSKLTNNIVLENDFLYRIIYSKLPYDAFAYYLGYKKFWINQLCRPIQIDISLTNRRFRKNKYKIKGKENFWRLEFNITQDKGFINRKIIESISEGVRFKKKLWREDYEINKELSKELEQFYTEIKLTILDNKLIRESSYLYSKTSYRYIVNQEAKEFYEELSNKLINTYILLKKIPDFIQSIKDLKYFKKKFRNDFNTKFRRAFKNLFKEDSESYYKFFKYYIPFIFIVSILILIISIPFNIIYYVLKKI